MIYYKHYIKHQYEIIGKRKKYDTTIYTFDIETSSYLLLNNKIIPAIEYQNLSKEEQEHSEYYTCMYIWMLSVNDIVYYGRTWEELKDFLKTLDEYISEKKFLFIHNLAFEFQYLKSHFNMCDVVARKSRKVMKCNFEDFNFECRCTYMMTNTSLARLPDLYNLPIKKLVGELDYTLIRTPITELEQNELDYCEHDCLVIYYYILYELESYKELNKIPITSTGHVRKELKNLVLNDFKYKRVVNKAINTNPHIYNLLMESFMGGYTHANWIYADEIINNVDSWDFTSSYPYVLVSFKYPSSEFKRCYITKREEMSKRFAYLLVVKFKNIKCKYFNNFISQSKCREIKGGKYDNGRVMYADELEITLTDIDFYFILDTHKCKYEIKEIYYANYNYLPKQFINFVLDKYVIKTEYKDVEGKEIEYNREKAKFNSLYGMSVTNTIRDEVTYDNVNGWSERQLTNEEIEESLYSEKKQSFLSFAYGVWVTAHARNNLLRNVIKLDEYVVYCDTDSIKVKNGYDKQIIDDYNNKVIKRINDVSEKLQIDINRYAPCDIKGVKHMLGVFDKDAHYEKFITQGAKKYAYEYLKDVHKIKKDDNVISRDDESARVIGITVSGVPKRGAKALKNLSDFKDDFVFDFKDTNKNLLIYCEDMKSVELIDYKGNKYIVNDKSGCCIVPTTYVLGKALEYANLITDDSSKRAIYREG